MTRRMAWYGAILGTVVMLGLAVRHRAFLVFLWRLFQARRQADRFYAECRTVTKNIVYSPATDRTLDVYRPAIGQSLPVVFYVYGGSWNSGNKELYALAAQRLLPDGVVLVVPDYTTYPGAGFPTQSQEIAAALSWTLERIADFGGDPSRLVVAAQSAGAQIAALALLDPIYLAAHGHAAHEVRGFIGISGVYDMETQLAFERKLRRSEKYVASVIGGRQNAAAASPLTFAGPHAPPALLIHGDADGTVPLEMSHKFHRRLVESGVESQLVVYPRGGHSAILFQALAENPSRIFGELVGFVRERTARAAPSQMPQAGPGHQGQATEA